MRLHRIDGTVELFRAHYSKRPDYRTADGMDSQATRGLAESLLRLLKDPNEQVTHCAVAFDNPICSFRNDLFAGCKSDEAMDPALRNQCDAAEEAVRRLGVTVWSMREFQADDALAAGAARFKDRVSTNLASWKEFRSTRSCDPRWFVARRSWLKLSAPLWPTCFFTEGSRRSSPMFR